MTRRVSSRIVFAVVTGVLLGGLTTGVTFAATASSSGVKACVNSHGDLALLSKSKCPHGYKATTISKQGPAGKTGKTGATGPRGTQGAQGVPGAQGVAGANGVVNARFDSTEDGVALPSGTRSNSITVPGHATAGTLSRVPAGQYLITASVTVSATDDVSGFYECTTTATQSTGKPSGQAGEWESTLAADATSTAALVGEVSFTATGAVSVDCYNYAISPNVGDMDFVRIALVPVTSLTATTG
jgi:hypothetical protein